MLRRHICGFERRADQRMRRGDVDDAPVTAPPHDWQRETRCVESRGKIDRQDRVPFLNREGLDLGNVLDPRVVNEDVEPAENFDRFLYQIRNLAGLRHVGAMVDRADAEVALDGGNLGVDCVWRREAVEHDARARMRECARDVQTYSACRAGDERDFAVERASGRSALHDFDVHRVVLLRACFAAFDCDADRMKTRSGLRKYRLATVSMPACYDRRLQPTQRLERSAQPTGPQSKPQRAARRGQQYSAPHCERIFDPLELRAHGPPTRRDRKGVPRACRDDELVKVNRPAAGDHRPKIEIDAGDLRRHDARIGLPGEDLEDRGCNVSRRQSRGRNLIERWLKKDGGF